MGCSISGFSSISGSSSYHLNGISWVRKAMPSIRLDAFWKSSSVGRYVLGVGYSIEYYYQEVRIKSSIAFWSGFFISQLIVRLGFIALS